MPYSKAPSLHSPIAVVLKLCSAEPWDSAGDFHGFRKSVSIITNLFNIISITSNCIFIFFSTFVRIRRWPYFQCPVKNNKNFLINTLNILFFKIKFMFKKFDFTFAPKSALLRDRGTAKTQS